MKKIKAFRIWAGLLSMVMILDTVSLDLYASGVTSYSTVDKAVETESEIVDSEATGEVSGADENAEQTDSGDEAAVVADEEEKISEDNSLDDNGTEDSADEETEEDETADETGETEEIGDSEEAADVDENDEIEELELGEATEEFIDIEKLDGEAGSLEVTGVYDDPEDPESYVYSGEPIVFKNMVVKFADRELVKGVDYTITYANNVNVYPYSDGDKEYNPAKAPSYTIKGLGNYTGSVTQNFTIVPRPLMAYECVMDETIYTVENGTEQKLVPVIKYINKNGKIIELKNNVDFVCEYPSTDDGAYVNEGIYEIVAKGINNYAAELHFTEVIRIYTEAYPVSKLAVKAIAPQNINLSADGKCEPKLVVSNGKVVLKEGEDYTLSYDNNDSIGNGIVTITGTEKANSETKKHYINTKYVTFKIVGTALNARTISCAVPASKNYDGEPVFVDDEIIITDNQVADAENNAKVLEQGKDYTLAYVGNNKAGKATITITGKGTYTGVVKKSFTIVPYDFASDSNRIEVNHGTDVIYKNGAQADVFTEGYTKGGAKPGITVTYNGKLLAEGTDYTLRYANNTKACSDETNAKCPYIIVTGKNGFKGNLKNIKFLIGSKDISECGMSVSDKVFARKAGNYTVVPVITDTDGRKLVAGTDYSREFVYTYTEDTKLPNGDERSAGETVSASDMVPVGAVIGLKISGTGNYNGSIYSTYRITGNDIAKASVRINTQYYTGAPVELDKSDIVITCGGRVIADEEYELSEYKNNINKGNAEVKITGVSDEVGGFKVVKFIIANQPLQGTVIFNGNGAVSGTVKSITINSSKKFGAQTKMLPKCTYKRPGYEFAGWGEEKDGSGVVYAESTPVYGVFGASGYDDYPDNPGVINLYAVWKPVKYTITYHLAGGKNNSENTKLEYTADDTFLIYPVEQEDWPVGYQFGGWYKEENYKTRIAKITHGMSGNLDLYAKWVPYVYKVKFNANAPAGKTVNGSMTEEAFSYGVPKALLANKFSVVGYAFAGWSDADGTVFFTDKQVVSEGDLGITRANGYNEDAKELFAVWRNSIVVKFESNGGANIPDMPFGYGDKVTLPVTTREGYDFAGWYMDKECKVKAGNISSKSGTDYTVYAKWNPYKYNVVFDKNDRNAIGTMPAMVVNVDDTVNLRKNAFINKGYLFEGWNTKADGTGTKYSDENAIKNLASEKGAKVILYAMWKETSYKVKYISNKGSAIEDGEYYYGRGIDKLPVPKRDGYDFKGWYSDVNCTKAVKAIAPSMYGDIVLYAGWTSDKSGDLTGRKFCITVYNLEDGAMVGDIPSEYAFGSIFDFPTGDAVPVRAGYTFGGWFRDAACRKKTAGITEKDNDDVNVYIKWVPKKYKVTFNAAPPEGTAATGRMGTKTLTFGKATAIGKNLFKVKGYSFMGWSMAPHSEYVVYSDNEVITGEGDAINLPMYAVWSKDSYNITYIGVDGITNDNPLTYDVDDSVELTSPQVMGNTFLGWYSDKSFKKRITTIKKGTTGNLTLYAKWLKNTYTILFDLNDNDGISYQGKIVNIDNVGYVTDYGDIVDNGYVLPKAERAGFNFGGWSKSKTGSAPMDALFEAPNVDTTLYAKWNPVIYKITYVLDGAEQNPNPATYRVSKNRIVLKPAIKCGYEFMGWFTSPDFNAESKKTEIAANEIGDITLYAKWQIIHYTIKFNANGGTGSIADVKLVGPQEYTMPGTGITRENYSLKGWNTKSDLSGITYAIGQKVKGIASHDNEVIILYAIWELDVYSKMIALKDKYPEGMTWTNNNFYTWKGGNSPEIPAKGAGCVAFAYILSDAAFGSAPAKRHTDFKNIRPGDIVRMNGDKHSVIVLKKVGDIYTIAEGNYEGKIHWGRTITQSSMNGADYVITRY